MRVAFVTNYDSADIRQWSGTGYYLAQSLEQQGAELIRINCETGYTLFDRVRSRVNEILAGRNYQIERSGSYLRKMANKVKKQLAGKEYDVVFSATSLPVSYLDLGKPIAFCADATYDGMVNFYPGWKNISTQSVFQGNRAERLAISNSSLVFYPSDWARNNAIEKYQANPEKVRKIPFGANMDTARSAAEVFTLVQRRLQEPKRRMLLIGVDWYRKGIDKAIEVARRLNGQGVDITLTIVGCVPPPGIALPEFVEHHPFISKSSPEGIALLNKLFEEAHFFILPTQAECYGVVFCEAASYGLPVITTNVGGVPSVVADGTTGFCIDPEAFIHDACKHISTLINDPAGYERMSIAAFRHYQSTLNWAVAAKRTLAALQTLVKN